MAPYLHDTHHTHTLTPLSPSPSTLPARQGRSWEGLSLSPWPSLSPYYRRPPLSRTPGGVSWTWLCRRGALSYRRAQGLNPEYSGRASAGGEVRRARAGPGREGAPHSTLGLHRARAAGTSEKVQGAGEGKVLGAGGMGGDRTGARGGAEEGGTVETGGEANNEGASRGPPGTRPGDWAGNQGSGQPAGGFSRPPFPIPLNQSGRGVRLASRGGVSRWHPLLPGLWLQATWDDAGAALGSGSGCRRPPSRAQALPQQAQEPPQAQARP